eukprot:6455252-Amphidinium_carterae.1
MPATPRCDDNCDRRLRVEIAQEARGADPFRSRWNLHSLGAPGVYNMCQAFLVAEIGKVDHLPAAALLHHMMDRT